MRYGEPVIKRAVPLALALLSVSNPKLNIIDTLSKFSHDADHEVAYNSIFAMGIVGAGTLDKKFHRKSIYPSYLFQVQTMHVWLPCYDN